jgi:ATP/maltotriose-dependent transcriptional regulator MalT
MSLLVLAMVSRDTGHLTRAAEIAESAVALLRGTTELRCAADVVAGHASIQHYLGHHEQAVTGYQRAIELAHTKADPYLNVMNLIGLSAAQHSAGGEHQSLASLDLALSIATTYGFRVPRAQARTSLAVIELRRGRPVPALRHAEGAVVSTVHTGHQLGQARARLVASHALRELGDPVRAGFQLGRALRLFSRIGVDADLHSDLLAP